MLEDTKEDVFLVERELKQNGIFFISSFANSKEDFEHSLYEMKPGVILSDHSLPQFNSIDALKIHQRFEIEIPVIASIDGVFFYRTSICAR